MSQVEIWWETHVLIFTIIISTWCWYCQASLGCHSIFFCDRFSKLANLKQMSSPMSLIHLLQCLLLLSRQQHIHIDIFVAKHFRAAPIWHAKFVPVKCNCIVAENRACKIFVWNRTTLLYFIIWKKKHKPFYNIYGERLEGTFMQASCGTRSGVKQSILFRCLEFHLRIVNIYFLHFFRNVSVYLPLLLNLTEFAWESWAIRDGVILGNIMRQRRCSLFTF
jgi:hypothetical protein